MLFFDADAILLGDEPVDAVYLGENLLWPLGPDTNIDDFNRDNGALGTAANGQAWSGAGTISGQKFTGGESSLSVPGVTDAISFSVDIDPGSGALGDQAYVQVGFLGNASNRARLRFIISQRNWFFHGFSTSDSPSLIASTNSGHGYDYDTPFRLYVDAKTVNGTTWVSIKKSALDGSGMVTLLQRPVMLPFDTPTGDKIYVGTDAASGSQFVDSISLTTSTIEVFSLADMPVSTNRFQDIGSPDAAAVFTVASDGGNNGPQGWALFHLRTNGQDFGTGVRFQKADSTAATDYYQRLPGGVIGSASYSGLGKFAMQVLGNTVSVRYPSGSGYTTGIGSIPNWTSLAFATTDRMTVTGISAAAIV